MCIYKILISTHLLVLESSCQEVVYSRKEIYNIVKNHLKDGLPGLLDHLKLVVLERSGKSIVIRDDMKSSFSTLFSKIRQRLQTVNRTEEKFFQKYSDWLGKPVTFPILEDFAAATPSITGRPTKEFLLSSERSKRRKTEELRSSFSPEELAYATQSSLRSTGQLDASKLVKEAALSTPTRASKYRKKFNITTETPLTSEGALSLLIELKLSKSQYQGLRQTSLQQNCRLYPSYKKLLEAKNFCYPPRSAIKISENCAEVKLQQLLNHTAERIIKTQKTVVDILNTEDLQNLKLFLKWGCDGSSGQSEYKQTFEGEGISDASVFLTSLVPLKLVCLNEQKEVVIWKNPRTSSARFCRPLRMQFLQETVEATEAEIRYVENQIKQLVPFENNFNGNTLRISYNMSLTMIDGKVSNAITGTKSTQRCYLCGETSKNFNYIDKILKTPILEQNLKFGLSTLHAWIRFFECVLHLSYKICIQKWQARNVEEKKAVEERKKEVQREFRSQLGLIVDKPKPGFGSSNDGNTARRFFTNYEVSSKITGVDVNLIKRFYIILQVISSGYDINLELFKKFSVETAKLFVNLYPWYYMPTSVHKVLIHGKDVIENVLLPIGQLSEEAQEARNKDIKKFRADFSRKFSRVKTMEDVFNRLLVSSDPYISSLRKLPQKKLKQFLPEALELFIASGSQTSTHVDSESEDVDSESELDSTLTINDSE